MTEALATAGPRYTPEIHVELPIGRDLALFGRTDDSIDRVKANARDVRKKLSHFKHLRKSEDGAYQPASKDVVLNVGEAVLQAFADMENLPAGEILFNPAIEKIELAIDGISESEDLLNSRAQEYKKPDQPKSGVYSSNNNPYWDEYSYLTKLKRTLQSALEQVVHADSISNNSLLVLNGAAGTGKTHLLCDFAETQINAGSPTVLLMGQRFVATDSPWVQILQQTDLSEVSAVEFVGALSDADPKIGQLWGECKRAEDQLRVIASAERLRSIQNFGQEEETKQSEALENAEQAYDEVLGHFKATLTEAQLSVVELALSQRSLWGNEGPPRFDLNKIQRYILRRVFDLGWTVDRFGEFDRYEVHSHGRDAAKAERMGKKYQWIAYHEILAFLSDHYRYNKQYEECDAYTPRLVSLLDVQGTNASHADSRSSFFHTARIPV